MEIPRYLNIPQANEYFGLSQLGFSDKWLYYHWREIKGCFKIGGSIIIDRVMVEEYFQELASSQKPTKQKSGRQWEKDNRHGLIA